MSENKSDASTEKSEQNTTADHDIAKSNSSVDPSHVDAEIRNQLEKAKNDYLYLRAEFDTYKRNSIKERSDLLKFASERVLVEVLNIMDNFERALATKVDASNIATYVKGVELTSKEMKAMIEKMGVTEIPALGQAFDPLFHEALSSEETSEFPEGHVARVFKKPYKLHDKVIRPGQVVVARKPTVN